MALLALLLAQCLPRSGVDEAELLVLAPSEPLTLHEITSAMLPLQIRASRLSSSTARLKACIALVNRLSAPLKTLKPHLGSHLPARPLPAQLAELTPSHCTGEAYAKTMELLTTALNLRPRRIGVILPLSGAHQQLAHALLGGAKAAASQAGERFEDLFVVKDSRGERESTLSSLAELVFSEGVDLLIGGLEDEEAETMVPLAEGLVLPMLVLNKRADLVGTSPFAFQVYPNLVDLADALAGATAARGYRSVSILRPDSGKADELCREYAAALTQRGIKLSAELSYQAGDYESMNEAVATITHTRTDERRSEYLELRKTAKRAAEDAGRAFDSRLVVLPPQVKTDAVFIPDHYRNVHFFVKLLKYHGLTSLPLIGNHEWRASELLQPWDPFLGGAIFADYIGSYNDLPAPLKARVTSSKYLVPTADVARVDFQLLGLRSAGLALQLVQMPFLQRQYTPRHLMKIEEAQAFFKGSPTFSATRRIHWPTYVFSLSQETLQFVGRHQATSTLELGASYQLELGASYQLDSAEQDSVVRARSGLQDSAQQAATASTKAANSKNLKLDPRLP